MKVYHGSYSKVVQPLAQAGRRNLDFGKGFYITRLKEQARKWSLLVASRRSDTQKGVVNIYEFDEQKFSGMDCSRKDFPSYDLEWLEFVVACRQGNDDTIYDIIEGGVANDQVIDTVEDYENGRITVEQALDQLKYKKPNNQICIRNQKIIDTCLTFIGSEEIEQARYEG